MIQLTKEEAQQVLDALVRIRWAAGERDKKNRVRDFDAAMDVSVEAIKTLRACLAEKEQEQVALPIPFRAQGQQIASDGDDKAFCDLYSKEQMLAYGKASELAIDKTMVKRIATQLGWKPPLDVEQAPVAWMSGNVIGKDKIIGGTPLYAAPPQREYDKENDAVEALTEMGWTWDGDQWQRPTTPDSATHSADSADAFCKREWKNLTEDEFNDAIDGIEDLADCWIALQHKLMEKNA